MDNLGSIIVVLLAANLVVGTMLLGFVLRRRLSVWRPRSFRKAQLVDAGRAVPPAPLVTAPVAAPTTPPTATWVTLPASVPVDAAIARATAFLRRRLRTGAYGMACTGNDGTVRFSDNKGHVFVASFLTEALAGRLSEIDRALILTRILSEESSGQWGFSPPGPFHGTDTMVFHVDADDTACVHRALRRLGAHRPAEGLLKYYRASERLFATFDAPTQIKISTRPSPADNLLAHPEVNANVFLALRGTHLEDYADLEMLRRTQGRTGGWRSYFYPSALYGTLIALDALAGRDAFADTANRGRRFVSDTQNPDGSWGAGGDPYETALAVAALAGHPAYSAACERGAAHLLSAIREDGSWASNACIWEFHAAANDVWRAYDTHRSYVTARCTIALRRAAGELNPFS